MGSQRKSQSALSYVLNLSGISVRSLLLVLPPLVAMLVMASFSLADSYHRMSALQRLTQLSAMITDVNGVINELQKERDLSAGFLGSGGSQLRSETASQYHQTEEAIRGFLSADRPYLNDSASVSLMEDMQKIRASLLNLNDLSSNVDRLRISPDESTDQFTAIIKELLDIAPQASAAAQDPAATRTVLALFDLMQAKERASQERAVGAAGFAAERFSPAMFAHFVALADEQRGFLDIFASYATPEQKQILSEALEDPASAQMDKLNLVATRGGAEPLLAAANLDSWLQASTERIDLLHDVEVDLGRHLESSAYAQEAAAAAWFQFLLIFTIVLTIAVVGLSFFTGRSLSRPIRRMTRAMTALAAGNADIEVPDRNRRDEIGAMAAAVEVFRADAILRRQNEQQIAYMARHDALTDLPNRLMLREKLDSTLARANHLRKCAVFCLDLDKFKAVNDTLGHPAGDALLQAVAVRLMDCIGENDFVARLGGDEFAVIQTGTNQPAGAEILAARIVASIAEPFDIEGTPVIVGASVGIAIAPNNGRDPLNILRNADVALYHAKNNGGQGYRFFETDMNAKLQARRQIETDMRDAVLQDQFELHYQPLIDTTTGLIVSFEALLRWAHPVRGRMSPADFVPVAEETGLIVTLGEWALHRACREAVDWPDDVAVAVNLSPIQFKTPRLLNVVEDALKASGLPPTRLGLEVTESLLLQEAQVTLDILHKLRSMGVRISLDDFGTGFSSLSYLRSFPFDKLKIDQCFVRGIGSSKDTTAIIRTITALGKSLHMTVTAEGVETPEQMLRLRKEGCDEVQGFLFSQAIPADKVPELLERNRRSNRNGPVPVRPKIVSRS